VHVQKLGITAKLAEDVGGAEVGVGAGVAVGLGVGVLVGAVVGVGVVVGGDELGSTA